MCLRCSRSGNQDGLGNVLANPGTGVPVIRSRKEPSPIGSGYWKNDKEFIGPCAPDACLNDGNLHAPRIERECSVLIVCARHISDPVSQLCVTVAQVFPGAVNGRAS